MLCCMRSLSRPRDFGLERLGLARRANAIVATAVLLAALSTASGADWPTYRGGACRAGVTAESLALPLNEAWVHHASTGPSPAWPESPAKQDVWHRLTWMNPVLGYDWAFQVAAADGRLYFGSSADDTVYCLDAATGETLWSFTTEALCSL